VSAVRVEKDGAIATVVLSRPEVRNAVDGPTAALLADAFREVEADDEVRVAVLFGDGGTFCSGADLRGMFEGRANRVEPGGDGPMGPTRMLLEKPVIAAVAGHAVAGGLELACWCDLRVAEESAVFGVFCRRWGVPLVDGGTVRLPRLIGLSRALDMILTGRAVDAKEAYLMGLANRVVADGTARAEAEALARAIAAHRPSCTRNDRRSAYESYGASLADAMARELALGMATLADGELAENVPRFLAGAGRGASGRGRSGRAV